MKKINELDNKYLVMKWDDVRNNLSLSQRRKLVSILLYNEKCREIEGKKDNEYVVLNQADELDLTWLTTALHEKDNELSGNIRVEDVAVDLVNSIIICDKDA